MSITKIVEPTGDLCIKFTEEEMKQLNIEEGDKFSWKITDEGVLLQKYANLDIDLSEFSRDTLEMLIRESCEKDISINEVICNCIENHAKVLDQS
jgi:hypothetical protein